MDWLQFIAAIVGHLAWPVVILIVIISVRKHLGSLAERILELSFGGATVKFDKLLSKGAEIIQEETVSHSAPAALPAPAEPAAPSKPLSPPSSKAVPKKSDVKSMIERHEARLKRAAVRSALSRVLSGLDEVDSLLFELGDLHGIDAASPTGALHSLIALDLLPSSLGQLYHTLRDARNIVAHANALPSESEAAEYERQIAYLKSSLGTFREATLMQRRDQEENPPR